MVYNSEICSTISWSSPMSTLSSTSNGCFTKRKIHEPRTSCVLVAKTKDSDSSVVPAVTRVVVEFGLKYPTRHKLAAPYNAEGCRESVLTEYKHAQNKNDSAEQPIKNMDCLVYIVQAICD